MRAEAGGLRTIARAGFAVTSRAILQVEFFDAESSSGVRQRCRPGAVRTREDWRYKSGEEKSSKGEEIAPPTRRRDHPATNQPAARARMDARVALALGRRAPSLATSTEQGASRTMRSATLPRTNRVSPLRPWVARTIRSHPNCSAIETTSPAGSPVLICTA